MMSAAGSSEFASTGFVASGRKNVVGGAVLLLEHVDLQTCCP